MKKSKFYPTEDLEENLEIEDIQSLKNKKTRNIEKFKKFHKRVKLMDSLDPESDHSGDTRFRSMSTPCSCYVCKGKRYGKRDRKWKEEIDE